MEVHNNNENYEDEIDLRELILVIWKQKLTIIVVSLIAAILTGIFSLFILSPVYHANMNIVFNMPDTYHTKFGDYTLPITTNQEYINLLTSNAVLLNAIDELGYSEGQVNAEQLREKISINIDTKNQDQNIYKVKVAAGNPEEAKKLAETLYHCFVEFINVTTLDGAVDSYYNKFGVELDSLEVSLKTEQELLKKNEELLAMIPQTIDQRAALDELQKQDNLDGYIVLENIINPNYTAIETDIINNKQAINSMKNSIDVYQGYLKELDSIQLVIDEYYQTGDYENTSSNIVKISDTSVYLPSQPIAPSQKTSPSNTKNVFIGTVLGGMLGVFIVLFRWWWLNGKEEQKQVNM